MTPDLPEDKLTGIPTPLPSMEAVASRIVGSRRRNPVEVAVFRDFQPGTVFTELAWHEWYVVILRTIASLGTHGLTFTAAGLPDMPGAETGTPPMSGPPPSDDPCRPIVRILAQLEHEGHVERKGACIEVTDLGKAFMACGVQLQE